MAQEEIPCHIKKFPVTCYAKKFSDMGKKFLFSSKGRIINKQAGAELGQAQLQLELGFTALY